MRKVIVIMSILTFVLAIGVSAEEHPGEHPGKEATHEHPGKVSKKSVTKDIKDTVKKYIDSEVKKTGSFKVNDSQEKGTWVLTYKKPHPVRKIDDTNYFLCADFKGCLFIDGKDVKCDVTLDLDFFLVQKNNIWNVTKVWIHKINGEVRNQKYFCPMHKDVKYWEKTNCPVCGMNMEENK